MIIFYHDQYEQFNNDIKGLLGSRGKAVAPTDLGNSPIFSPQILSWRDEVWLDLQEGVIRIYNGRYFVQKVDIEAEVYKVYGRWLIYSYGSELVIAYIS